MSRAASPCGLAGQRLVRTSQAVEPPHLPPELRPRLAGAVFEEIVRGGYSAPSRTFAVRRDGGVDYLKVAPELARERARAEWLAARGRAPQVLAFVRADVDYLLLAGLPGFPGDVLAATRSPEATVRRMAAAARSFHAVDVTDCPYRADAGTLLAAAEEVVASGRLRREDLSARYRGSTPAELLGEAKRLRPPDPDRPVMTHGDLCLPNVILDDDGGCGFVDVGLAGTGDRFRDLSLLDRSIVKNLGERWAGAVQRVYGVEPDPRRERFHALLDQLLMARGSRTGG